MFPARDASAARPGVDYCSHVRRSFRSAIRLVAVGLVVSAGVTHALHLVPVAAAPDPGWHGGTTASVDDSVHSSPAAQVVAPDGSTYVLMNYSGDSPYGDRVARFLPNGNPDPSFGTGGISRPATDGGATVLSSSSDGIAFDATSNRVLVAARVQGFGAWAVVRLTTAGQPDSAWGTQGWTRPLDEINGQGALTASASPTIVVDPLGRTIIAGYVGQLGGGPVYASLLRLTNTGQVDHTFGDGGLSIVPFADQPDNTSGNVSAVAVDGLGRIVVAGWTPAAGGFVARLSTDGALDPSFGTGGIAEPGQASACVLDMVIDQANGVLMLCASPDFGVLMPYVRRLDPAGAVDRVFGTGGVGAAPRSVSPYAEARSIALAGDRIVVGGWMTDTSPWSGSPAHQAALWRYTLDGDLDRGEGDNGVELIPGGSGVDVVDVEVAPNGSVSSLLRHLGGGTTPGVGVHRSVAGGGSAAPSATPLSTPQRLLDTRLGLGAPLGPVPQGGVIELLVTGRAGVPADAIAVAMNLTVTEPAFAGFATVYSCSAQRPEASNLNWVAGETVPNLVLARPDTAGRVCIFSSSPAHVIADVTAFYGRTTDLLALEAPVRRIDTRSPKYQPVGKIGGTQVAKMSIIPVPGQSVLTNEVVLNVTVTEPEAAGFITVYPCDQPRPVASNLNFVAGQTVANLAVVRVSTLFEACFFSNVPTHLVVDVQALAEIGSGHRPIVPARLLDTRAAIGAPAGTVTGPLAVLVTGQVGVLPNARAVTLNVTVTEPAAAGFVTLYPCGGQIPATSNVNFIAGQTRSNAVIVGIGDGGQVCMFSNVSTHLVADISEWLTARD